MSWQKDKKILKITIELIFILILFLGVTYAWVNITYFGEKVNILRAGDLELELDDSISDGILIEKAVPVSDTKGLQGKEYTFSLINNGATASEYSIYLDDLALDTTETRMKDSYVKYSISLNDGEEEIKLLSETGINPNRVISTGEINGKSTNNYILKVWIDSNADNTVMGTTFYTTLRVEATQKRPPVLASINKSKTISKIVFQDEISEPENAAYAYDVSESQTGTIMQYNVPNEDGTYTAYIQSNNGFYAPVNSSYLLSIGSSLTSIEGLEKLNTSNVENMSSMFISDSNLTSVDLSNFNTSKVTDMSYMFFGTGMTEINLDSFDLSKVTTFYSMFQSSSATVINLSNKDLSSATNFSYFLSGAKATELNINGISAPKLKYLYDLYTMSNIITLNANNMKLEGITSINNAGMTPRTLKNINMKNLYAPSLISISKMFSNGGYSSDVIDSVDISGLVAPMLTSMDSIFSDNYVKHINMSNIDVPNLTTLSSGFAYTKSLEDVNFTNFTAPSLSLMNMMFYYSDVIHANISDFDSHNLTNLSSMMYYTSNYEDNLDMTSWDTSKVTNMDNFVSNAKTKNIDMSGLTLPGNGNMIYNMNLDALNLSNTTITGNSIGIVNNTTINDFDFSNAKINNATRGYFGSGSSIVNLNMSGIELNSLTSVQGLILANVTNLDLSDINFKKVTGSMSGIFPKNSAIVTLKMDNISFPELTDASGALNSNYLPNLQSLSINNFNAPKVTSVGYFLAGNKLTELTLDGFYIDSATNIGGFISFLSSLEKLSINNFNAPQATSISGFITRTNVLKELTLNNISIPSATEMYGFLADLTALEKVNISNFDADSMIYVSGFLNGSTNLKTADLSGISLSNVTDLGGVLTNLQSIENLDISGLDFSNITSAGGFLSGTPSTAVILVKDNNAKEFVENALSSMNLSATVEVK